MKNILYFYIKIYSLFINKYFHYFILFDIQIFVNWFYVKFLFFLDFIYVLVKNHKNIYISINNIYKYKFSLTIKYDDNHNLQNKPIKRKKQNHITRYIELMKIILIKII